MLLVILLGLPLLGIVFQRGDGITWGERKAITISVASPED
jgi:hypothetical protein